MATGRTANWLHVESAKAVVVVSPVSAGRTGAPLPSDGPKSSLFILDDEVDVRSWPLPDTSLFFTQTSDFSQPPSRHPENGQAQFRRSFIFSRLPPGNRSPGRSHPPRKSFLCFFSFHTSHVATNTGQQKRPH
ncbi:unnamed protein product [Protopolystoma xenopodis]|uniref:Uncharacterized protein n=1 Tax=Protopolystoma xenopodis TaxID=117903 RepID=A0A448XPP3_9PLAT|nr:unnamed protein product [Protopolystoma xenopodis]